MVDFDPYYEWLAIPPRDQPPHHYRLLGIELFEDNANVIERAADKQMAFLRTVANSRHAADAKRLLNEVSAARICLMTAAKKAAYDEGLRLSSSPGGQLTQSLAPKSGDHPRRKEPAKRSRRLGEYEVLEKIGAGGMGEVFKAQHLRMKRVVALKVLPRRSAQAPDAMERFQREVEAAAKLTHPNIVTAYDAGEEGGISYLAMEYVDGVDLRSFVKQHGPLPVEHAVACILQAARGLQYAHEQGIVHRDVKPANLLIDRNGTVKILDMGLARIDDLLAPSQELTSTGQIVGTVEYMSPEQAEDTHRVDHRADIYSLGCTLYRLLTGQALYAADSQIGTLLAHRQSPIRSLCESRADVPASLDAVFQKMVAKLPDARFRSMAEVATALESCQAGGNQYAGVSKADSSSRLHDFFENLSQSAGQTNALTDTAKAANTPIRANAVGFKNDRRRIWPLAVFAGGSFFVVLLAAIVALSKSGQGPGEKQPKESTVATPRPQVMPTADTLDATKWEDLLALIDTKRDAKVGEWQLKNGKLLCTNGQDGNCLVVPISNSGSYSLRACFVSNTEHGISLAFPVGKGQCEFVLDSEQPENWTFMELVEGHTKWDSENPTRSNRFEVVPGKEHMVEIDVRVEGERAAVHVRADKTNLIAWEGLQSSLTLYKGRPVPPHKFGIGGGRNKQITKLCYAGSKANEGPQSPDREAAEWVLAQGGYIKLHLGGSTYSDIFNERAKLPAGDFRLVDVYLERQRVADADLAVLTPLEHLGFIKLGGTQVDGSGLRYLLNSKARIIGLVLTKTSLDDRQAETIAEFNQLRTLLLDDTLVSDRSLEKWQGLSEIITLDLRRTQISDKSLQVIAQYSNLEGLSLDGTAISDDGLAELRTLAKLKTLSLIGTNVSPEAVAVLQTRLPRCKVTGPAELSAQVAVVPNTKNRQAAEWAISRSCFIKVKKDGTLIEVLSDRKRLPEGDFQLTDVCVEHQPISDEELAVLGPLMDLSYLKLVGTNINGSGLRHLLNSKEKITGLVLSETPFNEGEAGRIAEFHYLKFLHLDDTSVSDQSLEKWTGLQELSYLELRRTKISDNGLKLIARYPRLSHLALDGTSITDDGLLQLRQPSLKTVSLIGTKVSPEAVAALQKRLPMCKVTGPAPGK